MIYFFMLRLFITNPTDKELEMKCKKRVACLATAFKNYSSKAMLVFQTSQTLPTRLGPSLSVSLPGFQPDGVASVPLLLRTY